MKAVIGLGNPGKKYEFTRHNIGFRVIDRIVGMNPGRWQSSPEGGATLFVKPNFPVLAKPETFMNESGIAVSRLAALKGVEPGEMLVISDEIQMNVGQIKFSAKGSSGGHNGLESIIAALGTEEFHRLRFGVRAEGEKATGEVFKEYVLGDFPPSAKDAVESAIDRAAEAAMCWFRDGLQAAMNRYN